MDYEVRLRSNVKNYHHKFPCDKQKIYDVISDCFTSSQKTRSSRHRQIHFNIESEDSVFSRPRQFVLIDHNVIENLKVLRRDGIDLDQFFDVIGVMNTQILIEDLMDNVTSESLEASVTQYKLYDLVMIRKKGKQITDFQSSHCAGNDAVATLELENAFAFDSIFGTDAYIAAAEGPAADMSQSLIADIDTLSETPLASISTKMSQMDLLQIYRDL
ncbi:hypothetical protein IMSHALPRED_008913 [Imshaugia aleurites]|uniref:Gfd2/YDR514C-like C-terminal domain-containing protein n=1 Tax=Imshaugia aleurites TaxID=172621 RepID=A0A8H3IT80_9LECA|nr:hypothetical protein IMSHALPRED_008913 [Imshaugia aleurites]